MKKEMSGEDRAVLAVKRKMREIDEKKSGKKRIVKKAPETMAEKMEHLKVKCNER